MKDMEKLCNIIKEELDKIAEKGLNTSNLETAYKLIDMYKDLKDANYHHVKTEYYEQEMDGGYSEARYRDSRGRYSRDDGYSRADGRMPNYDMDSSYRGRRSGEHYVRGHYSRDDGYSRDGYSNEGNYSRDGGYSGASYDHYMDSKASYRSNKSSECKHKLMESLEEYMDDFTKKIEDMSKDADCQEEKDAIMKYVRKLQNIR